MESIYDKDTGLQTEVSGDFGKEIREAVKGILKRYVSEGYSFRDLSHEAQGAIRDLELDFAMDSYLKQRNSSKEEVEMMSPREKFRMECPE